MFQRPVTTAERARQAQLEAQQEERRQAFEQMRLAEEQRKAERAAAAAERQAFVDKALAARAAFQRGEQMTVDDIPTLDDLFRSTAATNREAAMQKRKEASAAAKAELENGAANTPAWLIDRLPPGDPLRKAAAQRAINPEDFE